MKRILHRNVYELAAALSTTMVADLLFVTQYSQRQGNIVDHLTGRFQPGCFALNSTLVGY